MNKNLLVGATLALALSGCSNEPEVVASEESLEGNFYVDVVLAECREKYEEYFLSEMCYQSETNNESQRYFVPEVIALYTEKSSYDYSNKELLSYEKGANDATTYYLNECEKESDDCIQKSYFIILKAVELNLSNENNDEKRKELISVYFYILDKWLASLVKF